MGVRDCGRSADGDEIMWSSIIQSECVTVVESSASTSCKQVKIHKSKEHLLNMMSTVGDTNRGIILLVDNRAIYILNRHSKYIGYR